MNSQTLRIETKGFYCSDLPNGAYGRDWNLIIGDRIKVLNI